jgi:MFS family permease
MHSAAMFVSMVPLYIAEVAPPAVRGLLVGQHGSSNSHTCRPAIASLLTVLTGASFLFGYTMASWISVGSFFATGSSFQWRFPCALQSLWPILLLFFIRGIPESPRWCKSIKKKHVVGESKLTNYRTVLSNGQPEKAWEVIAKLHADPNDPSGEFAREEFHQMSEQIARDNITYGNVTILDMFRKPSFRKRIIAAALVMASSQLTGNLVIYSTSLTSSSASSSSSSSPSTKTSFHADTHRQQATSQSCTRAWVWAIRYLSSSQAFTSPGHASATSSTPPSSIALVAFARCVSSHTPLRKPLHDPLQPLTS